jgi:signal transduction histidine kinase
VGQSVRALCGDRREILEAVERALAGQEFTEVIEFGDLAFETSCTPLRDAQGEVAGVIGVATDVSERRRLEDRLRHAQRMEAIGRLAGGVAHDFNNLLAAILGHGELMMSQLEPGHALRRNAEEIQKAGVRGALLTRQLLAFSRRQVLSPAPLDLNLIVTGMDHLLRRLISAEIEVMTVPCRQPAFVKADRGQVEQVLMNLALNARDAMPGGGRLRIATDCVGCDHHALPPHELDAERFVRLVVSDTGIGMSPEVQAKAFEPFFTTKDRGRGTGLGLATVWSIVSRSGGALWLDSTEGSGTTVTVLLPAVEAVLAGAASEEEPGAVDGGIETVLVVEDEEAVRRLTCRILSDHGYRVLSASDGPEALDVAALHPGPVDLLLTDVVLPSMNGIDLAARMAAVRPGIRSLAISGYVAREVLEEGLPEGLTMLPKPFKRDALLARVREALGSG